MSAAMATLLHVSLMIVRLQSSVLNDPTSNTISSAASHHLLAAPGIRCDAVEDNIGYQRDLDRDNFDLEQGDIARRISVGSRRAERQLGERDYRKLKNRSPDRKTSRGQRNDDSGTGKDSWRPRRRSASVTSINNRRPANWKQLWNAESFGKEKNGHVGRHFVERKRNTNVLLEQPDYIVPDSSEQSRTWLTNYIRMWGKRARSLYSDKLGGQSSLADDDDGQGKGWPTSDTVRMWG